MRFLICSAADLPAQAKDRLLDSERHRQGKLWVTVTNYGQIGGDSGRGAIWPGTDTPGQEAQYINRGGFYFGGIVPSDPTVGHDLNEPGNLDTLVSEGPAGWSVVDFRELFPPFPDQRSAINVRSADTGSEFFSPRAVSDEDFISAYTDTFLHTNSGGFTFASPKHQRALGLEIIQKSYQFLQPFAEDILFFDLVIRNVGENHIRNFYVGLFVDNDVFCISNRIKQDEATGFMRVNAFGDTVNTAWILAPDGGNNCVAGVVGVRILRPATPPARLSYNWWSSDTEIASADDWGPVTPSVRTGERAANEPVGTPVDDPEKYILMSNGDIDYDQFDLAAHTFDPRIPPGRPNDASRFLLAVGPIGTRDSTISDPGDRMFGERVQMFSPGDSLLFTLAIIGGEGDPATAQNLGSFDPAALVDLGKNSVIASSLFDTPGVDTDGDGFAGEDSDGDGIADRGDGMPDFKGPQAPPSPPLRIINGDRRVTLDWTASDPARPGYDASDPALPLNHLNLFLSDDPTTEADERKDFEGFRVLRSNTGESGTFEVLAEFDIGHDDVGRNTGLAFRYVDHVSNGSLFYYAVASFSREVPELGLDSRQSSPSGNLTKIIVSPTDAESLATRRIWVEPNPFIAGSGLRRNGPGTGRDRSALDFVNVPARSIIRIFTPDGDVVQTLVHTDANCRRVACGFLAGGSGVWRMLI